MIGHLGARVSALLDGQLSTAEAEEAWRHVYGCHACRDLVEREGWVKCRLAGLAQDAGCPAPAPYALKGSLLSMSGDSFLTPPREPASRRLAFGAAVVGGGAVGAALLGVVALGIAPGSAGPGEQRPPATQIGDVAQSPSATPTPTPTPTPRQRRQHTGAARPSRSATAAQVVGRPLH